MKVMPLIRCFDLKENYLMFYSQSNVKICGYGEL